LPQSACYSSSSELSVTAVTICPSCPGLAVASRLSSARSSPSIPPTLRRSASAAGNPLANPVPAAKQTIRAIIPEVIAAPRRCLRAWRRALASVAPVRERPFPNSSDHNSDRYGSARRASAGLSHVWRHRMISSTCSASNATNAPAKVAIASADSSRNTAARQT
jgi:hypothetical protein